MLLQIVGTSLTSQECLWEPWVLRSFDKQTIHYLVSDLHFSSTTVSFAFF